MKNSPLPRLLGGATLALLGLLALASTGPGQTTSADAKKKDAPSIVKVPEAGVQFDVPSGWRTQQQKDGIQISAPDGSVSVVITMAANDNTELMITGLKEYMKKNYQNFKAAGELQKEQVNGLRAIIENGSGETTEGPMEWNIAVLMGARRPVIAFTVADKKGFANSQTDYVKLVQSIRRII